MDELAADPQSALCTQRTRKEARTETGDAAHKSRKRPNGQSDKGRGKGSKNDDGGTKRLAWSPRALEGAATEGGDSDATVLVDFSSSVTLRGLGSFRLPREG